MVVNRRAALELERKKMVLIEDIGEEMHRYNSVKSTV
jgi:hypothetical protein